MEQEPASLLKLEVVIKRHKFRNKTLRGIHISERFNERDDPEKYDQATEKGQRYCVATTE